MLLVVALILRVLHHNPLPSASFHLQRHKHLQLQLIISFYIHLLPRTVTFDPTTLHYYYYYINITSNHLVISKVISCVILKVSQHNKQYVFTFAKIRKVGVAASAGGFLLFLGTHLGTDKPFVNFLHPK